MGNRPYPEWQDIPRILEFPVEILDLQIGNDIQEYGNPHNVWITEYNISESRFDLYGSWLHALQLSTVTLWFLNYDEISKLVNHETFSRAQWGSIFSNRRAYAVSGNHSNANLQTAIPQCLADARNDEGMVSAPGLAMSMLTQAMRFSEEGRKVVFQDAMQNSPTPVDDYVPEVYGWHFTDTEVVTQENFGDKMIIMNLSDQVRLIDRTDIQNLGISGGFDRMQEVHSNFHVPGPISPACPTSSGAVAYTPLVFPRFEADNSAATEYKLHMSDPIDITGAGGPIALQPYSLNYFYQDVAAVKLTVMDDEACHGDNVFIYADISEHIVNHIPAPTLTWSIIQGQGAGQLTVPNPSDNTVREYQITSTSGTAIHEIKLRVDYGGLWIEKTVVINVDEAPVIDKLRINGTDFLLPTGVYNSPLTCDEQTAVVSYDHSGTCQVLYPHYGFDDANDTPYQYGTTPPGNEIELKPDVRTEYTIIVMDDRGCTASVELHVDPLPKANAGRDMFICNGLANGKNIDSDPAVPGWTYEWVYPITGIPAWVSSDARPFINSTMFASNQVQLGLTISYEDNCISSDVVTVHFVDCCPPTEDDDYELPPDGRISDVLSDSLIIDSFLVKRVVFDTIYHAFDTIYSLDFSSRRPEPQPGQECINLGRLVVNGRFVIDENFELVNTVVFMGEKAHFEVMPGYDFIVRGSEFVPCSEKMWSGIDIRNYRTSLDIDQNIIQVGGNDVDCRCRFEGADTVINAEMDAAISVHNSDFDNNFIHISIKDYHRDDVASVAGDTIIVENCTFDCSTDNLISPHVGQRTFGAILLDDVNDIDIGINGYGLYDGGNTFDNCDYGIKADKSSLTSLNNTFNRISKNYRNGEAGNAIYATSDFLSINGDRVHPNDKLHVGSVTQGTSNNFTDCNYGVVSRMMHLNVIENNFTPVSRGVKFFESEIIRANILDNVISGCLVGIDALQNTESMQLIDNNTITTEPLGTFGNPVTKIGIRVTNISPLVHTGNVTDITNNTINLDGTHGILVQSTTDVNMVGNTIDMNQVKVSGAQCPHRFFGIRVENSNLIDACSNTIVGDPNAPISAMESKIAYSQVVSTNCIIRCNYTDNTTIGMEFLGQCSTTDAHGNSMLDHDIGWSFGATNCIASPKWFFPDQNKFPQNGTDVTNGNNFLIPQGANRFDTFKHTDATVSGWQFEYDHIASENWPDDNGNSLPPNAVSATVLTGIGQYTCEINSCDEILTLFEGETESVEEMEQMIQDDGDDQVVEYEESKKLFIEIEENQSLTDSSNIIDQFHDSAQATNLALIEDAFVILNDTNSAIVDSLLSEAWSLIDAVNALSTVASNEKEVIKIYIEGQQGIGYADAYYELLSIAFQCPYIGGNAVFSARAMLSIVNDSIYFNDTDLCQSTSSNRVIKNEDALNSADISVYPVPTNSRLNIQLSEPSLYSNLAIYDPFGRVVHFSDVIDSFMALDVSHYPVGQYYVRFNSDFIESKRARFTIVR